MEKPCVHLVIRKSIVEDLVKGAPLKTRLDSGPSDLVADEWRGHNYGMKEQL